MTKSYQIFEALIGLVGAVGNNGKTNDTDAVIRKAILLSEVNSKSCPEDNDVVEMIHKEKYAISPNCQNCKTPCGNTSDGKIVITKEKQLLIETLIEYCKNTNGELPNCVYKAISYLGYDLEAKSYLKVIDEIKER